MSAWTFPIRLDEVPLAGRTFKLAADDAGRAEVARTLDLAALDDLSAQIVVMPWFDGVELRGAWSGRVVQTCVVTLEPLPAALAGEFMVRVVPAGSRLAPDEATLSTLDPEADDPPDVSENGEIDLAGYVIEHLSLELDPYPRKPGAEFTPPAADPDASPFAVLRALKKD